MIRLGTLLLLAVAATQAQPRIHPNGVVNAASFLSPEAPGGAIAQGSIFSIFGEDMGPRGLEAQEFPLPTVLGGVEVLIFTGEGENFLAPLLYVGANQINAILPSGVPAGRQLLRVQRDGVQSNDQYIKVVEASVGLFEGRGFSYGRPRPVSNRHPLEPLHSGDAATLWATGLGPSPSGDFAPVPAGDLPTRLKVFVGGLEAEVSYLGRAPCCAGLDQINFVIPQEAPLGCFVPVWVEVGGDLVSNVVTLDLAQSGGACEDAHDGLLHPSMLFLAEVELQRTFVQDAVVDSPRATMLIREVGMAIAPFPPLRRDDIARTPPASTCLVPRDPSYASPFFVSTVDPIAVAGPIGAGSLELPSLHGSSTAIGEATHHATPESNLLLEPGRYTANFEGGGASLPPFAASLETGAPAIWNNRDAIPSLARESGLTLQFDSEGRARRKILASLGTDPSIAGPEIAVCQAESLTGELHIPRAFLANIAARQVELTFSDTVYEPLIFSGERAMEARGWIVHRRDEKIDVDLGPVHLASTPVTLPSGEKIQAELAASGAERARGLMQRPVLNPDKGMLFLFETEGVYSFWMLNTLVPLDIIWMNSDREIQFINADTPPCQTQVCPTYGPSVRSRYVLELAAGEAARRGLEPGDVLSW